jgi:hypothetical protein
MIVVGMSSQLLWGVPILSQRTRRGLGIDSALAWRNQSCRVAGGGLTLRLPQIRA